MNAIAARQILSGGVAALIGVTCLAGRADAQSPADRYPEKPLRIIVLGFLQPGDLRDDEYRC